MAKLISNSSFIGSLAKVSFYKMSLSDELIMHRKGGNLKEESKQGPNLLHLKGMCRIRWPSTANNWTRKGMKVVIDAFVYRGVILQKQNLFIPGMQARPY